MIIDYDVIYNKASFPFSRSENDRRRIEEEEDGVHTGSGASLYVACIIPLGERRSRETGRGGREENWLLSLDWEEEEVHACTRSLLRPAPTDSDMLPRNGGDDNACSSYQPRSDREGLTQRERERRRSRGVIRVAGAPDKGITPADGNLKRVPF